MIFALAAGMASLPGGTAHAATVTVTDCGDSGAAGQLRTLMNAATSGDTINIPACTITITGASGDDLNASGDLDFTKNLTLAGAGASSTIIDGGGIDRVFHVTGAFTVNISGVTVRNGRVAGVAVDGGGLYNNGGTLTITNSTFSGNSASGNNNGGGIFNNIDSTTTITNSTFSGNSAGISGGVGGSGGSGGGLFNSGTLTVTKSTFSGNSAFDSSFGGGGIYSDYGTVTIGNSTFSSNTAAGSGGGLYHTGGSATITNSTFSGNSASGSNGGGINRAGGVGETVTLRNTIVANSTTGGNCAGTIIDGGNNLDSANTCGFTTNAKINTNPNLGVLTGSPQYFPLNSGSAAIDAGSNTVCAAAPVNNASQNGVTRPMPIGGTCDIGSYEYRETTPPIAVFGAGSVPPSDGAILNGGPSMLLVQFSENILNDGSEHSVTSVWNYMLVRPGPNGIFDTTVTSFSICDSDHIAEGDDERIEISGITYNPATFTATLTIYSAYAPLANGQYRLYLCGAASIWDLSSNALNGGTNTAINFTVSPAVATAVAPAVAAAVIPATGFAPHRVTVLPPQTVSYAAMGDLWLEIPKLGVQMNIVGVPQTNGTWDVKWLGNDAGWLQGSAFPTWAGNSVLTGHVWNANNTPGVFVNLKNLKYGDQVRVHAFGQVSTYEVRESRTVWPSQVDVVLQHKDLPTLTLLTCEDYHILWGTYSVRRMVRAVLVSVAAEIQNP